MAGALDPAWSDRLGGLRIESLSGDVSTTAVTVLEGFIQDPAQLSGVLNTLCDLRLPLLGVFLRFHYAPGDRNPWNMFVSGGVGGRGVIPGRPNDRYGLGFYKMFASNDLKEQPILGDVLDDEWGMEVFYNIALTPWLQLSPGVQYVQPGVKSIDHSTIVSTRLQVDF